MNRNPNSINHFSIQFLIFQSINSIISRQCSHFIPPKNTKKFGFLVFSGGMNEMGVWTKNGLKCFDLIFLRDISQFSTIILFLHELLLKGKKGETVSFNF